MKKIIISCLTLLSSFYIDYGNAMEGNKSFISSNRPDPLSMTRRNRKVFRRNARGASTLEVGQYDVKRKLKPSTKHFDDGNDQSEIMHGTLIKLNDSHTAWKKRRFFVLKGGSLEQYRHRNDWIAWRRLIGREARKEMVKSSTKTFEINAASVSEIQSVRIALRGDVECKLCFQVRSGLSEKVYTFQAPSEVDYKNWIEAFKTGQAPNFEFNVGNDQLKFDQINDANLQEDLRENLTSSLKIQLETALDLMDENPGVFMNSFLKSSIN